MFEFYGNRGVSILLTSITESFSSLKA